MFKKTKITKKEYFNLIEKNIHFNLGTIYSKDLKDLEIKLNDVESKLSDKDTFNNLEFLEKNCLKCVGALKNTIDFIHLDKENNKLYENQKGKFFKVLINGITYVYHYYNDNYNTISFKAIII